MLLTITHYQRAIRYCTSGRTLNPQTAKIAMRLLADKATAPFSAVDVTGNYRAVHQAWTSSIWGKPLVAVELIGSSKTLQERLLAGNSLRQKQFLRTEVYLCTAYECAAGETVMSALTLQRQNICCFHGC